MARASRTRSGSGLPRPRTDSAPGRDASTGVRGGVLVTACIGLPLLGGGFRFFLEARTRAGRQEAACANAAPVIPTSALPDPDRAGRNPDRASPPPRLHSGCRSGPREDQAPWSREDRAPGRAPAVARPNRMDVAAAPRRPRSCCCSSLPPALLLLRVAGSLHRRRRAAAPSGEDRRLEDRAVCWTGEAALASVSSPPPAGDGAPR